MYHDFAGPARLGIGVATELKWVWHPWVMQCIHGGLANCDISLKEDINGISITHTLINSS